jgi:hypothetical protein
MSRSPAIATTETPSTMLTRQAPLTDRSCWDDENGLAGFNAWNDAQAQARASVTETAYPDRNRMIDEAAKLSMYANGWLFHDASNSWV